MRLELPARLALEEDRGAGGRLLRGRAVALARLLAAAAALGAGEDLHHRRVDLARDLVAARTTVLVDEILGLDEGLALLAPAGLDDLRVVFARGRLLVLGLLRVLLLVLRFLRGGGKRQRQNGDQGRDDPHGFLLSETVPGPNETSRGPRQAAGRGTELAQRTPNVGCRRAVATSSRA